jgi:NADPH-dependent 2,4-dienoyl-CoA reductase/sulfur reductase-like enzyme
MRATSLSPRASPPLRARRAPAAAPRAAASSPDVDVAIVGGGPAGLATARALARAAPQLTVAVLERAREMLPVGFTIGLMGASDQATGGRWAAGGGGAGGKANGR